MNDALREFAQNPDRYTWISGDVDRFTDERVCVIQGSVWAGVSGVRVGADDVEALLLEVRERVPPEKALAWWARPGREARPTCVSGCWHSACASHATAAGCCMRSSCVEEPPPGPEGIEVTRVEAFEDHLAATEVMWETFDTPPERRAGQFPHLRTEFEAARDAGVPVTFLASSTADLPASAARSTRIGACS